MAASQGRGSAAAAGPQVLGPAPEGGCRRVAAAAPPVVALLNGGEESTATSAGSHSRILMIAGW